MRNVDAAIGVQEGDYMRAEDVERLRVPNPAVRRNAQRVRQTMRQLDAAIAKYQIPTGFFRTTAGSF